MTIRQIYALQGCFARVSPKAIPSTRRMSFVNNLSREKQIEVIAALCEGVGIRTQGNRFRLTGGVSDQRLEVVGIEVGEFSPNLEAVLVFWISHEVDGHVFDDGHVLRPIAAA